MFPAPLPLTNVDMYSASSLIAAYLGCICLDAVFINRLEHSATARAADGVPSVRVEVQALRKRSRDFGRSHYCRQGQAIANALHTHMQCSNQFLPRTAPIGKPLTLCGGLGTTLLGAAGAVRYQQSAGNPLQALA